MRHGFTVALVVVVAIAMTTACWAQGFVYGPWQAASPELESTSSWFGFTGLVRTPSALISPPQKIAVVAHQIKFDDMDHNVYGATVGLTPALEIGAARVENVPQDTLPPTYTTETVVNVKYKANIAGLFNNPAAPTMAIGIYDMSDQINRVNYVVLSQSIGLATGTVSPLSTANAHIGYGRAERDGGALDGVFGGVDFVPFESAHAQIEYDGEDLNAALRYYLSPWLSLDAGTVDSEMGWGINLSSSF